MGHYGQYIMEDESEARRLDLKTEGGAVERQATWAGIAPGMRVADVGCGSGRTTSFLHRLVQPGGEAIGIDASPERIAHARERYGEQGPRFVEHDFRTPLDSLGSFDFIWVRFVLEYHRSACGGIVDGLCRILRPGGILCLIDLDHNCLNHFGLSPRLERSVSGVMGCLEELHDFDPYVGRKLYSFLYDAGLSDIRLALEAHHLIYGELSTTDDYNWTRKVEVAAARSGYGFPEYPGGFEEFREEFRRFFADPRRFTYTPMILCRGVKG